MKGSGKYSSFELNDAPQVFDPMLQDDASVESLESENSELARKPDIDDDLFNLLTNLKTGTSLKKKKKSKPSNDDDASDKEKSEQEDESSNDSEGSGSDNESDEEKERVYTRDGIRAMKLERYKHSNKLSADDNFLRNYLIKAGKMKDDPEFAFQGADEEDYHFDTSKLDLVHPKLEGESERKSNEATSRRTVKHEKRKKRQNDMVAMLTEAELAKEQRAKEKRHKENLERIEKKKLKRVETAENAAQNEVTINEKKHKKIEKLKKDTSSDSDSSTSSNSSNGSDSSQHSTLSENSNHSSGSESDSLSETNLNNHSKMKISKSSKLSQSDVDSSASESEVSNDSDDSDDEKPDDLLPEELERELMEDVRMGSDVMDQIAKREEEIALEILEYIRILQEKFLKKDGSALSKITARTYEEFDAQVDTNDVVDEIFYPTFDPDTKSKEELELRRKIFKLMTDYHSVYSEFANNSHKFKYRKIEKVNFGMSAKEILQASDSKLNRNSPIDLFGKPYRRKNRNNKRRSRNSSDNMRGSKRQRTQ